MRRKRRRRLIINEGELKKWEWEKNKKQRRSGDNRKYGREEEKEIER